MNFTIIPSQFTSPTLYHHVALFEYIVEVFCEAATWKL